MLGDSDNREYTPRAKSTKYAVTQLQNILLEFPNHFSCRVDYFDDLLRFTQDFVDVLGLLKINLDD